MPLRADTDSNPGLHRQTLSGIPGVRLDVFLADAGLDISRSQAQRLIDDGLVDVSGAARKANYRLRPGDTVGVVIPAPEPVMALPEDMPVKILYEDEYLVVVDKAAGMVVHPASGNYTGTLVNALLHHCGKLSSIGGELRPGVVHRLDKDTSGVIVLAKDEKAHMALADMFKAHILSREYVAVATGNLRDNEGTVTVSIGRHVTERKKMSPITFSGKEAITHYRVLERFGAATYVALRLKTGRTHQIRVHMAHIGHPLAGDRVYGGTPVAKVLGMKVGRQMLHAGLLGFNHPVTGEYMEFTSEPPEDMQRLLKYLREKASG
ncbi:MAG TPA: RluA family pseudouridine synthase [Nitrospirota bacterium]|jgi:23S rRNA pseudouridine1911/1915/1917 synthase